MTANSGPYLSPTETDPKKQNSVIRQIIETIKVIGGRYVGIIGGLIVGDADTDPGSGAILATASIKSNSPSAGIGYAAGAGGAVTQGISKASTVTLNKVTGQITTSAEALASNTTIGFTFLNSTIDPGDVLIMNITNAAIGATVGGYLIWCDAIVSTAAFINIRNITGGSLSESLVINYVVVKGSST